MMQRIEHLRPQGGEAKHKKRKENTAAVIPPFLQKTFDIFSNPEYSELCVWGKNNDSILIKNIEVFSRVLLPKYFKHNNYTSFTRQLHKYDFHKTIHNPLHGEFRHPYFLRGRPDLLQLIKRKIYVSKAEKALSSRPPSPPPSSISDVSGATDEETDTSSSRGSVSEKDGFEQDFDFDFDFLCDDDGDANGVMDFDQFDGVESTVERGIIAFDNDRLSALEESQKRLVEENESMKLAIRDTMKASGTLESALECLIAIAVSSAREGLKVENAEGVDDAAGVDEVDDLCGEMKARCALGDKLPDIPGMDGMTDEMKCHYKLIL